MKIVILTSVKASLKTVQGKSEESEQDKSEDSELDKCKARVKTK